MPPSLSTPNFPNAALGLDRSAVTAIAVQRQGKSGYGIKQAATVPVPPGVLIPSFLDRNISDPNELASCLLDAVRNAGMGKQKRWSVALPSNTARTAILTLDAEPASKQETEEILDWKAEQSFGAPSGELRILKRRISASRDGRPRYFSAAIKLAVMDEYETIFESLGWKSGLILPKAIGEANWLSGAAKNADSLLISSQSDGFTALLLRGEEPYVVRSVTCLPDEIDDEVYRLLMFYNDRVKSDSGGLLETMLLVGSDLVPERISAISTEALGRSLRILGAEDVGFYVADPSFNFDEIAAAAGLAALS
jgi:hypothetical protein